MAGLTSTGFEAKALTTILQEMKDEIHANISANLNLEDTSLLGQYLGVTASQLRQVWEAAQEAYAARDPDQAEDAALEDIAKITGTRRNAATYSTTAMTITLTNTGGSPAGTYAAGSLRVNVTGDATIIFDNDEEIVVTDPSETLTDQPFTCVTAGAMRAEANTLTTITTPVTGFSAPTNPAAAVTGSEQETVAELRLRRELELARAGSSTVDAIRADVLAVEDVTFCRVYENDSDSTDGDGRPPHSFECVVLGGTTAAVAAGILGSKPAGIASYGTTSTTASDDQGNTHTIKFTRPTELGVVPVVFDLTVVEAQYAGDDAVVQACLDWADGTGGLSVGVDIPLARLIQLAMSVDGVYDATVEIDGVAANYSVGAREIATLGTTGTHDITVNVTYVSGAP